MKKSKSLKSFRLSDTTIRELETLSKSADISQADVIAILVHLKFLFDNIDSYDDFVQIARGL